MGIDLEVALFISPPVFSRVWCCDCPLSVSMSFCFQVVVSDLALLCHVALFLVRLVYEYECDLSGAGRVCKSVCLARPVLEQTHLIFVTSCNPTSSFAHLFLCALSCPSCKTSMCLCVFMCTCMSLYRCICMCTCACTCMCTCE